MKTNLIVDDNLSAQRLINDLRRCRCRMRAS